MEQLRETDPEIADAIQGEIERERQGLEMIASENFTSIAVLEAQGSVMTNKYAEGYPGERYYGGCKYMDRVEQLAIDRAKEVFDADHVNVQLHSGTQANMAVYQSVLEPGDKIMGMDLTHGGHLSHGHPVNFSGKLYEVDQYGVDVDKGRIDYGELEELARESNPDVIISGASAYPREIDFKAIGEIANDVDAYHVADIAHIAGLVAGDQHMSPINHADFVTTTTHKTLRGPRGGMVMCRDEYAKDLDKAVFPGIQGGPLMHVVAAKAVCLKEALSDRFREYQEQIVRNTERLGEALRENGWELVSGGSDNHLVLVDLLEEDITGKQAEEALEDVDITVNKNTVPGETESPTVTSGIRIGTPAITVRGIDGGDSFEIGELISNVIDEPENTDVKNRVSERVSEICDQNPLYSGLD